MTEILISDSNFIIAIIVFVICFVIGFFGDLYMRKNNKIGSLLDVDKKKTADDMKEEPAIDTNQNTFQNNPNANLGQMSSNPAPNNVIQNDEHINNLF